MMYETKQIVSIVFVLILCCGLCGSTVAADPKPAGDIAGDFSVTLPDEVRPMPEPLPAGPARPGFKIRGIKGWGWTPEQYLEEIPVLAKYKMNFLMNCYLSMFSDYDPAECQGFSFKDKNRWWQPIPEAKKRAFEKVIRCCQKHGIQFCFAMHPQLGSSRPIDPTSDEDFEKFWPHFAWAQGLDVQWFCIPLDDVDGIRIDGAEHAEFVNKLFARLRAKNPRAQLFFCPTWYRGTDLDRPDHRLYLQTLGRRLHKDVYIFWTGDACVPLRVTRKAAEAYKDVVKHRLILWENYPVNDDRPTMHLGPITGRDADLCEVVDGYMSNPLCQQNQINRIPLLTCADYAYNPKGYDPKRSIGQAIVHLAATDQQRLVLKELVECYPGMLICGSSSTGLNPVRERFERLVSAPQSRRIAANYIRRMEELLSRVESAFPDEYKAAQQTIDDDINWLKKKFASKYKL